MPKPEPLASGQLAPVFSFEIDGVIQKSDQLDAYCLLYFYPKDDTPGCTTEACAFRDNREPLQEAGILVVGASKDSDASHEKFRAKHALPFPLIADTGLSLARAFGVFGEKKFMGRTFDGVHRISFLIAPGGTIAKTYHKVKPADHAAEVLRDVAALKQST